MQDNLNTVVHLIGAFCAGGAEVFVSQLAGHMAHHKKTSVLSLSCRIDEVGVKQIDWLNKSDVYVSHGPTDKVGFFSLLWLARKLVLLKPEVIHLHTPNTELAYFLIKPFLLWPHRLYRTIHNTKLGGGKVTEFVMRNNRAVCSIACGVPTELAYREIVSPLVTVLNGVDFTWPVPIDRSFWQQKLNLDNNKFHFLHVGSQSGEAINSCQKGQDRLIFAWRASETLRKVAQLHIIGDGNLNSNLRLISEGDESIIFHGIVSNVIEWMSACSAFVFPSRFEGLPIAAIEALGSGINSIFSDIPELLFFRDVSYVEFFDSTDSNDLRKKLEGMLLKERPSDEDVNKFRGRFDVSSVSERYCRIYSDGVI